MILWRDRQICFKMNNCSIQIVDRPSFRVHLLQRTSKVLTEMKCLGIVGGKHGKHSFKQLDAFLQIVDVFAFVITNRQYSGEVNQNVPSLCLVGMVESHLKIIHCDVQICDITLGLEANEDGICKIGKILGIVWVVGGGSTGLNYMSQVNYAFVEVIRRTEELTSQ